MSRSRRMAMVDRGRRRLSVVKQCRLLKLSRSSVYYRPKPTRPADLELMASMDRQYLKTPYYGSRRMTAWLLEREIKVSMDGKGRYLDNIFVERLWRSVKYEEVYLKAYRNGSEARRGIDAYLDPYKCFNHHIRS